MEKKQFLNKDGQKVFYLHWQAREPRAAVVIAHGMVEHPDRYDDLANFFNDNGLAVYGLQSKGVGIADSKAIESNSVSGKIHFADIAVICKIGNAPLLGIGTVNCKS